MKRKTGKVKRKANTATRGVGERRQKAAIEKATSPVESPTSADNDTVEVRSSMKDVIDDAKKLLE